MLTWHESFNMTSLPCPDVTLFLCWCRNTGYGYETDVWAKHVINIRTKSTCLFDDVRRFVMVLTQCFLAPWFQIYCKYFTVSVAGLFLCRKCWRSNFIWTQTRTYVCTCCKLQDGAGTDTLFVKCCASSCFAYSRINWSGGTRRSSPSSGHGFTREELGKWQKLACITLNWGLQFYQHELVRYGTAC